MYSCRAPVKGKRHRALHTVASHTTFQSVSTPSRPDATRAPKRATAAAIYGELPDRIYTTLREQIIRGRLAPDLRLVEVDLASRFAVSRTPVREALARLVREGYVVALGPGRRTSAEAMYVLSLASPRTGIPASATWS